MLSIGNVSFDKVSFNFGVLRQKVTYAATIAGLLLLLWAGHRTHWRFAAAHDGESGGHEERSATPSSEQRSAVRSTEEAKPSDIRWSFLK